VDLAVLIQPYLKQDLGGVIFTCNPIGDDENDMLIEASYGGASNVVNGKVDIRETLSKSSYKSNYKIFNNLAEIANYIENLYGYPVDIEWGAQNQKIYIFQVRPITTLSNKVGEYHD
jgi:pyruvate,water dikinase